MTDNGENVPTNSTQLPLSILISFELKGRENKWTNLPGSALEAEEVYAIEGGGGNKKQSVCTVTLKRNG